MGVAFARQRAREIRALPSREWKGQRLRTARCWGTRGKGQHVVHLPESLLWSLIAIEGYCCPYHHGDDWREHGTRAELREAIGLPQFTEAGG